MTRRALRPSCNGGTLSSDLVADKTEPWRCFPFSAQHLLHPKISRGKKKSKMQTVFKKNFLFKANGPMKTQGQRGSACVNGVWRATQKAVTYEQHISKQNSPQTCTEQFQSLRNDRAYVFYALVGEQSLLLLVNILMSVPMFTDRDGLEVNTQKGGFGGILPQAADHGAAAPHHDTSFSLSRPCSVGLSLVSDCRTNGPFDSVCEKLGPTAVLLSFLILWLPSGGTAHLGLGQKSQPTNNL